MATAVEGLYMNPQGWIPIANVTVTALSTDGYTEGTDTTDANGHFRITGLSDRNWLSKVTGSVDDVGVFVLVPVTLLHGNLQTVEADQHHLGFEGILDNSGTVLVPDSDDKIQIIDDGKINADQGNTASILSLSIDETQVDHGSIAGLVDDDHTQYVAIGGRTGGQGVFGSELTDENLTLASNPFNDGSVILGTTSLFEFDEAAGQLKLATSGSSAGLLLGGDALLYRVSANLLRTPDGLTVDGAAILSTSLDIAGSIVVTGTLDEDDMTSDSNVKLATQQSIKKYVDDNGGAVATDVIWDAKGDLAGGTGADTAVKLVVGTNDQVLTAASGETTGMKWATAAAGGGGGLVKSITVENPDSSENLTLGFFFVDSTVTEIQAVVVGSSTPSVTILVKQGTHRDDGGTTSTVLGATAITSVDTGQNFTSFTDATIPADNWLWLETNAQSGTVTELHVTVLYTED